MSTRYTPHSDNVAFASPAGNPYGIAQLTGALGTLLIAGNNYDNDQSYALRVDGAESLQRLDSIVSQTPESILDGIQSVCYLLTRATFLEDWGNIPPHVISDTARLIGDLAGTAVELNRLAFCVKRGVPVGDVEMPETKPAPEPEARP